MWRGLRASALERGPRPGGDCAPRGRGALSGRTWAVTVGEGVGTRQTCFEAAPGAQDSSHDKS